MLEREEKKKVVTQELQSFERLPSFILYTLLYTALVETFSFLFFFILLN